jgi:hypothetical protein
MDKGMGGNGVWKQVRWTASANAMSANAMGAQWARSGHSVRRCGDGRHRGRNRHRIKPSKAVIKFVRWGGAEHLQGRARQDLAARKPADASGHRHRADRHRAGMLASPPEAAPPDES